jgi:pimeloyl-ACP methyl ester carboxylesterase
MNNKIYLIHGFNVGDEGLDTTDSIRPYLEELGYQIIELDYGHYHVLRVKLCNNGLARLISKMIEPGSTCIGHSNGCAIIYEACKLGAPFKNVVLVNPALDSNTDIPGQVKKIQVWYSPHDRVTWIAKFIPNFIWGSQGSTGYTGKADSRYTQFNEDLLIGDKSKHSGIWKSHHYREILANKVNEMIKGP